MAENLETDYGMLAFSADAGSRANISPFVSGFHLEVGSDEVLTYIIRLTYSRKALLRSDVRDADVLYILDRTFGTMLDSSRDNYTGRSLSFPVSASCSQFNIRNLLGSHGS